MGAAEFRLLVNRNELLRNKSLNEADALEMLRAANWTVIAASGPAVLVAMVVGISIALMQALTQVQEMTLTFIPKIVAILLTLSFTATFIGAQLLTFASLAYARIENGF